MVCMLVKLVTSVSNPSKKLVPPCNGMEAQSTPNHDKLSTNKLTNSKFELHLLVKRFVFTTSHVKRVTTSSCVTSLLVYVTKLIQS